jgi:hypothetical protein
MSFFPPPSEPFPPGYPLPALDVNAARLEQGMLVRILSIPGWLTHDLPDKDVAHLKTMEGAVMPILEIDAYGMIWFGESNPWFSLKPFEVAAIEVSSQNAI